MYKLEEAVGRVQCSNQRKLILNSISKLDKHVGLLTLNYIVL